MDANASRRPTEGTQLMAAEPAHPAAWMIWTGGAGVAAFTTTNPLYLALIVAACWFVYTARRIQGPASRSFRFFMLTGVLAMLVRTLLVAFGTVNVGNVVYAALEGMRLATLLVVFGTFNAVTDPFGVVRLAPRRFHEPALAAALALSIAPRTVEMIGRVREAQQLRGIHSTKWRSLPALAVPVLSTAMEEAVTLAESMDSRGHGSGTRSRYRPQAWTGWAFAMATAAALCAAAFGVAAFGGPGGAGLNPSTAPLMLPQVDIPLLLAIGLLAVPGFGAKRELEP
jgi:energy-coupling factor transport system permease protein